MAPSSGCMPSGNSSTKTTLLNNTKAENQQTTKRKKTYTNWNPNQIFKKDSLSFPTAPLPKKKTYLPRHHELQEDWHFVFGGDTCDKGPGSLRCLHALVSLKKRHPDRVHLLTFGREKNRLVGMLDGYAM